MGLDKENIETIIVGIANRIQDEGMARAADFWNDLSGDQADEARRALRRLAENQLHAISDPSQSERYLQNAANNINTLINLAAGNKIAARREARAMMNSVMGAILDAAFEAIDIAL